MVVKYFSWIKEHIGKSEEKIDLPSNITNVNQLINYLNEIDKKYNIIFEKKELIKIAVNKTYSSFDTNISNSDEIAFFPPVTGG
jgi:molybdopterin synthase sulfur carrier subunit